LILILLLFSKLLLNETNSENRRLESSRLEAHLPPIADSLYRWSEKKTGLSLWSTFGFGETSTLSPQIRLFCRYTSTFIASRIVSPGRIDTQFTDRIKSIEFESDFKTWSVFISAELIPIFQNSDIKIADLYKVIYLQAKVFFPDQVI
jgi:hypothetical protein